MPEVICLAKPGHMGWLACPTHNREIMERMGRHVGAADT